MPLNPGVFSHCPVSGTRVAELVTPKRNHRVRRLEKTMAKPDSNEPGLKEPAPC